MDTLEKKLISHLYSGLAAYTLGIASKAYSGPFKDIIQGQGWDFAAAMGLYHVLSIPESLLFPIKNKIVKAASVFGMLSVLEIGQYFGIYPGTFDPKDFIAYAVGVLVALGIDKIIDSQLKTSPLDIKELSTIN